MKRTERSSWAVFWANASAFFALRVNLSSASKSLPWYPERVLKAPAQDAGGTRQRIVEAAFETLRFNGFAGTSARSIARAGGFSQALIFYHFGSVHDLLLAALDWSGERRMTRYREALAGIYDLPHLLETAALLYREDEFTGYNFILRKVVIWEFNS